MKDKVIVFAPHPDDEVLGCGGTIAKKLDEGYDVTVIFMTDGRNFLREFGVFSQPSPLELKEVRKKEAKRAAKIIGIPPENLTFLDVEDGTLKNNEKMVQEKIIETLKERHPKEIFFPQEKEFNIDHRITNRIVRNVIRQLNFQPVAYQFMIAWKYPFNLLVRVHPKSTRNFMMSKLLKLDLIHIDISEYLHLKKAALKEYKSQLKVLSHRQRKPALKKSFLQRFLIDEEGFFLTRSLRNI